jgi:acyl carrier protein
MTRSEVQERLTSIFREVFQNPALELWEGMAARDVAGWDSLNNVRMVLMVEAAFKCRFTLREIGRQQNVGEFMDLILKKTS